MGRGDSNTFMGGRPEGNPLQGLCQRYGAAPVCWLMMCSAIMACYKKLGHGSSTVSPMSGERIEFMGERYVNDLDLLVCLKGVYDLGTVVVEAQKSLDAWANLLNATGGILNTSKCYWYPVYYICRNNKWEYGPRLEHTLTIPLPDGSQAEIEQINIADAKKMLGVWST
jgi:hypothetical protein